MWYLVVIVVAALVSVALAPKPPEPKPASLSDVDAPTAEALLATGDAMALRVVQYARAQQRMGRD